MLQAIKKLDHCRVIATDGQVGTVRDVYFDDERWVVRYLVVETGSWLSARRVLISPYAVRFIDWQTRAVVVNLTRDQVQKSPHIDTDKPVSRQQEDEFNRHYGYPQYWPYSTYWAWGEVPLLVPPNQQDLDVAEMASSTPPRWRSRRCSPAQQSGGSRISHSSNRCFIRARGGNPLR